MIALITGDIINSRKMENPETWIKPLKILLNRWGKSPETWEIYRGDSFQLEITKPEEGLLAALQLKSLIKSIADPGTTKRTPPLDVRLALGIGAKTYSASRISESNGEAFIRSGEKFELLKSEMSTLAVNSPWEEWNHEMNLLLKLASIQMDSWSVSSGELMREILTDPSRTQSQLGKELGIGQNSVSKRYKAAHAEEILEVEKMYRKKLARALQ